MLPQLPGTAFDSWSAPAGWSSPLHPAAELATPPAWPSDMAPGKEEEESASVTSCAAPDEWGALVLLRLSSNHKNSQRRRRCSETGSGFGGEGPATSRVHQSVATGSQNETGWILLGPVRNTRAEVVLFIELWLQEQSNCDLVFM